MPQMPSKPMMPQQGMPRPGMPPQGGGMGGDAMGAVKQNMSIFNPTDATAMRESGQFRPDMTIRDFFAQQGVDVDGPVTQLLQFVKDQAQKASPLNKMQAIAGQGASQRAPAGPQAGQGPSAPPPELGSLLKGMRG